MTIQFTEVNIDTAQGNADDYAVMEKGKPETAITLMGWDEVGLFDHEFTHPVYVAWVAGGVASAPLPQPNDDPAAAGFAAAKMDNLPSV